MGTWVCGCTAAVRRVQWWGYVSGGAIASGWCGLSGHHVGAAPGWPTWRCTACIYVPAGEAVSRACGEVGHVDAACDTPHCQECGMVSEGGAGWVAGVGGWVGGWHVASVGLDAVRSVQ